jgi:uncharacterized membrane protein
MRTTLRRLVSTLVGFAAAAFMFAAPLATRAQSAEEITSFAADYQVREDGTVGITERIDYYFPSLRHGIFRDIPTSYVTPEGKKFTIPLKVIAVTDGAGKPWKYQVTKNSVGIRIKIGDPDIEISGPQQYAIQYEAVGALRYFADHDEFYWNVTGNEWTVPLRRVSAVVHLPSSVPMTGMTLKCYTGAAGSTAQDCLYNVQGSNAHFAASEPLTVVVGFPPGLVAKLEPPQPSPYVPLLPFLIPVAAFGALVMLWRKKGRDPEGRGTLVVQYEPPEGMRPAEVGTLIDENAGLKDVSATIVDLAVRGYLKIREVEKKGLLLTSKDYEFERLKDYVNDKDIREHERKVLKTFFSGTGKLCKVSDLKENHDFYEELPGIKTALYEELVHQGHFPSNPDRTRGIYIGIGAAIAVLGVFLFRGQEGDIVLTLMTNLAIALIITGVIVMLFAKFMAQKTLKGVLAAEHAFGFQDYLAKAEKYRLEWQEKENVFEKFLPYAMAFGVAEKWSKAFESMNLKPPSWYEGGAMSRGVFNTMALNSMLGSMNSAMTTAMRSAPQSSSGGSGFGGGSSGGGGGGGGGGSW